jgi:polyphenol oxidase
MIRKSKAKEFSIFEYFWSSIQKMKNQEGNLTLFQFENLSRVSDIVHFVTSRAGGVSKPPYDTLNLGLHTADNKDHVLANRMLLANATGIDADKFLYAKQIHSGDALIIDRTAVENGILTENPGTDAMITSVSGICLMVMVADCVPILLFDPVLKISAVIHAGWRGTVQHIVSNTVRKMIENFGSDPADIIAGIGPSSGPCCYEVGEEVVLSVEANFGNTDGYLIEKENTSKPHFDLWYSNRKQLIDCGLNPENIETAKICTQCNSQVFFSSRASGGITGRFAAGICF